MNPTGTTLNKPNVSSDNTKQFCDILAKAGNYRVVLPDFFLGERLTKEMFLGMDRPKIMEWITAHGSLPVVSICVCVYTCNIVAEQLDI
jgi:hypothetical protein